jgi:uncharacterized membrane protein YeaQ/YmgE (transglycosylase-associated protein family)
VFSFIFWIIFGLIVGAIAKLLMPGKDDLGWIATILLGIGGSFVGGFLSQMIFGSGQRTAGWIGSILGAVILLALWRFIKPRLNK